MNMMFRAISMTVIFAVSGCGGGGGGGVGGDGGSGGGGTSIQQPKHTVLVYMVGSDLERKWAAASTDLLEMTSVENSPNLKVVVETGGSDSTNWRTVQRHVIGKDDIATVSDLGSVNMGSSVTLEDFLEWGIQNYPADRYTLIFWDHGGGSASQNGVIYGIDEIHSDGLSLPEIRLALQNATASTGRSFDLIGFDACLMATLEVANTLSPFGKILVASQESEPGTGWNYAVALNAIRQNPSITNADIGRTIADSYLPHSGGGHGLTMSVLNLEKIPSLVSAVETFATHLQTNLISAGASARLAIAKARNKSESYGKDVANDSYTDMVDLRHLMQNLSGYYPADYSAITSKVIDAVVYRVNSSDRNNSGGISIYMPHRQIDADDATNQISLESTLTAYEAVPFPSSWSAGMRSYIQQAYLDTTAPTFSGESVLSNTLTASVTAVDLQAVAILTGQIDASNRMRVWLLDSPTSLDDAGNVQYHWAGAAVTLGGHPVAPYFSDIEPISGDEYFDIPINYNGAPATIKIRLTDASPDPVFEGLFVESAGAPRREQLEYGAVIQPVFRIVDFNTDTDYLEPYGPSFTFTGTEEFQAQYLPTGTYAIMMVAADFSGNFGTGTLYTANQP